MAARHMRSALAYELHPDKAVQGAIGVMWVGRRGEPSRLRLGQQAFHAPSVQRGRLARQLVQVVTPRGVLHLCHVCPGRRAYHIKQRLQSCMYGGLSCEIVEESVAKVWSRGSSAFGGLEVRQASAGVQIPLACKGASAGARPASWTMVV